MARSSNERVTERRTSSHPLAPRSFAAGRADVRCCNSQVASFATTPADESPSEGLPRHRQHVGFRCPWCAPGALLSALNRFVRPDSPACRCVALTHFARPPDCAALRLVITIVERHTLGSSEQRYPPAPALADVLYLEPIVRKDVPLHSEYDNCTVGHHPRRIRGVYHRATRRSA